MSHKIFFPVEVEISKKKQTHTHTQLKTVTVKKSVPQNSPDQEFELEHI